MNAIKKNKHLFLILIAGFLISCDKECDCDSGENEAGIDKIEFHFDSEDELESWTIGYTSEGDYVISDDSYSGIGSLKFSNGCVSLIRKEGIPLKKNTNYQLTIASKCVKQEGNDFCYMNNPDLGIILVQGDEWLLWEDFSEQDNWEKQYYYFRSDSTGLPIQIRLSFQEEEGWIDELIIEEQ